MENKHTQAHTSWFHLSALMAFLTRVLRQSRNLPLGNVCYRLVFVAQAHGTHRNGLQAVDMGGHPMLLSFSGMAKVLKWPPRLPLVAPCDRARVLRLWARQCRGRYGGEWENGGHASRLMRVAIQIRCMACRFGQTVSTHCIQLYIWN